MSTTQKIIKETKYCEIHNQGRYVDEDYTYCIEKIYVKDLKRFEIRFSLYKDLKNHTEKYIARSLDVTELELAELFKDSIANNVFSSELIEMLRKVLNPTKKTRSLAVQKEKQDDTSNEMLIEEEPIEEKINSEESV